MYLQTRLSMSFGFIAVFLLLLSFSQYAQAGDGTRACRALGSFTFTFKEFKDGQMTKLQTYKVNIRQSDMNVVGKGWGWGINWRTKAKKEACKNAARLFTKLAAGKTNGDAITSNHYESIHMPPNINKWRRDVACSWARSGKVPGIKRRNGYAVKLYETLVSATAKRDNVSENDIEWAGQEKKTCWGSGGPARRTNP